MNRTEEEMSHPDRTRLLKMVGRNVHVTCHDGHDVRGVLVNVSRRSLWLTTGSDDEFVRVEEISSVD